jgi:methylthioribose-1-phosphate isomerase
VAFAIREMIVRGAPAIGPVGRDRARDERRVAGGWPTVRAEGDVTRRRERADQCQGPPRFNLRWAVERVLARYTELDELSEDGFAIARAMREEADAIVFEATTDHGRLAGFGLEILPTPEERPVRILTHCNTGPLACGQYGTALGIVQAAHHADRPVHVWVDETRPYLQGARLTTWELAQAGVPHALIPDVAAGHLMAPARSTSSWSAPTASPPTATPPTRSGPTRWPCSRPATASRSTSAHRPARSTSRRPDGSAIADRGAQPRRGPRVPRRPHRAARHRGPQPAFDVTPAELITGIVTEEGVLRAVRAGAARRHRARARALGVDARLPAIRPARRRPHRRRVARPTAAGRQLGATDGHRRRRSARLDRHPRDDRQGLLRSYLERDRLYAAYAICDLEEREFARTRWGIAYERDAPIALGPGVQRPDSAAALRDGRRRTASRRSCAT